MQKGHTKLPVVVISSKDSVWLVLWVRDLEDTESLTVVDIALDCIKHWIANGYSLNIENLRYGTKLQKLTLKDI